MITVRISDLRRRYTELAVVARKETIEVLRHGKPAYYMVPPEEYQRLRRGDRRVYAVSELPAGLWEAIMQAKASPEGAQFNHDVADSDD